MLPFERYNRWVEHLKIGAQAAVEMMGGVADLAAALIDKAKPRTPKGRLLALIGRQVANAASAVSKLGAEQLTEMNSEALAKKDYMAAVLTGFALDLETAESEGVLLRSKK